MEKSLTNNREFSERKNWFSLNKLKDLSRRDLGILIGVQVLMLTAIFIFTNFRLHFEALHFERMETLAGQILVYSLLAMLVFQLFFLGYIVFLYFKYKAVQSVSDEALPTCTIIVPAYNEGKLVYDTLISISESNFPKEKMEIIAVDDGSKDDTWYWINKANADLNYSLTVYKQPKNKGKRHALYRGFTTGSGEIFITIDSDSVVEKDTIRNLVSPFVVNKNCGGVAGNVKVLNKQQGIIPKMLNVSFVFSFEFVRAAQSSLGFVLCTPGALSAYKREAVMYALEDWIEQRFLGNYATIGEDRAMTNMILKQGYEVQFQRNANVLTNTPTGFKTLHKMFTRWGRSNVRETLAMNQFVFKNFREKNKSGARLVFINQWMTLILAIPMVVLMFYFFFTHPFLYLTSALVGTFIFSSIQMLFFTKKYNFIEALWAYPYSVFYMFALFWIYPFSILTVKNGGWLTR
ncbi:glycosyltransferase [Moheibacter lacus]|uniref:N-acetylglucosaminyltransferase n=1 Tax=Moheibacter lacus TaxID=2745851 RepID=A0A838ZST2_9FLAO|nr:glycosyltransferase [Moheibacter lacus]MBA5630036.1 glycosyltransferase family 2 protein [Moheibacter lacus]